MRGEMKSERELAAELVEETVESLKAAMTASFEFDDVWLALQAAREHLMRAQYNAKQDVAREQDEQKASARRGTASGRMCAWCRVVPLTDPRAQFHSKRCRQFAFRLRKRTGIRFAEKAALRKQKTARKPRKL